MKQQSEPCLYVAKTLGFFNWNHITLNLTAQSLVDKLFKLDRTIRYVGIVDEQYRILESKIRPGFKATPPFEKIRDFISLTPPIIVDAIEKMQPQLGKMEAIYILYTGMILGFFRMEGFVVVLGFPVEAGLLMRRITNKFEKLAAKNKKPVA